jgi:hypothetical protein
MSRQSEKIVGGAQEYVESIHLGSHQQGRAALAEAFEQARGVRA